MKFYILIIFFIFFSIKIFAEDIKIIELHGQSIDQGLINAKKLNENAEDILDSEISDAEDSKNNSNTNDEIKNDESSNEVLNDESQSDIIENEVTALPGYWENANKEEILFLFENINTVRSKTLNKALINSLTLDSVPPNNLSVDEFNYIKIENLIKLGQRKKAFDMISNINDNLENLDFYNVFKLNYYFSTYELNQACEFNNTIDKNKSKLNPNFLLKVDIFCTFIQGKAEESDLLNSLLLDTSDKDDFFQKIFTNLKNSNNSIVSLNSLEYDKSSMSLYSAMIRVGDMPLSNEFLEYDSVNLSEPIILSPSSNISLRLRAAHKAYSRKMFNAESLSALYQTVDFNYEQLNNYEKMIKNLDNKTEIGMAYLFQRANIQILPITRIQTLVDFWEYAEKNNLSILAYDISRKLIESIEPSSELSDFGIEIAKAHIYNENYDLADKWILFSENYKSEQENLEEKIQLVKFLYNLKSSKNDEDFINILIANLYQLDSGLYKEINKNSVKKEILLTILSVANENLENNFSENRKLVEQRNMPSRYLLKKIKNSYKSKIHGELILSIVISLNNYKWSEIHPEHLRVILVSLKDSFIEGIFREIIIEILEETKII
tara:strand:- start:12 stop:1838 length:1827 start_codon:yes stop_codon:yes gene_type:complete